MKYSYNWLKVLSGTKLTPEKLANLLMMRSFEFEEMKKEGKETQLEFAILPNRAHDMLSHMGMAREICTVEGRRLKYEIATVATLPHNDNIKVEVKDKRLCPRYIGAVLENIEVKSSPKWMQERLLASGVKPINNIVDITNYVMLETGQPLHAFDLSVISEQRSVINIVVRRAKKGERIKLLDETEKELTTADLVIANDSKPIALAGIMGGSSSGITNKTTSIVLESANFDPVNIRKTRTRYNIITESSYRFEREIDPNLAETGVMRAIELLKKIGGSDVKLAAYADIYPKKLKPWEIRLDINYIKSLLGENISLEKIKSILNNLDLGVAQKGYNLLIKIPTIRLDLKTQEDLIEEIGRIYGYENIPAKAPVVELSTPAINEKRILEDKLRDILIGSGFSEVMNYSFYSADDIEKCGLGIEEHFEVANPMNPDQQYMRTSLVPGILKNIELNLKNFEKFSIFEIGKIYKKAKNDFPDERTVLCSAIVNPSAKDNLFFELKGKIEAMLENLGVKNIKFEIPEKNYFFHPARIAEIKLDNTIIGKIGEINPQLASQYGIKQKVAVFFLQVDGLIKFADQNKLYSPISKFPSVKRDISMFVLEKTKYADIESKIYSVGGKLVLGVELFDVFEKDGEKSMALRVEIGSSEKTLTSTEIDGVMKKIIAKLEKDLKVKVRK